ncbi:MAG: hypothetical protein MUC71_06070 [Steroidobacteraceae bacterium]|nr:hypothetical protein [Steroidobacteraceae bacterium]
MVVARWLAALPPQRRARLERLRNPADRAASLAGLALLVAAARAAGLAPPDLARLEFPDRGKPRWPGGPDFSVSHGGGHVGCALIFPTGRVGLDLERADAACWHDLRLVLAPGESPGEGAEQATEVWVGKEAVLKAAGATLAEAAAVALLGATADFGGRRWQLSRPALAPGIACAVASDAVAALEAAGEDAARLLALGP